MTTNPLFSVGYFCRKEILVEKVKSIETELMKISLENSIKNEENVSGDEEEREQLNETRYR